MYASNTELNNIEVTNLKKQINWAGQTQPFICALQEK